MGLLLMAKKESAKENNNSENNFEEFYVTKFSIIEQKVKKEEYSRALNHLRNILTHLNSSTDKKQINIIRAEKYAEAIQKIAYKLSIKLRSNPALDKEAIAMVDQIEKKYGVSPHFALEKPIEIIASIIGVFGGLFMLSGNITGNAIANFTNVTSSFIGAGLLVLGIVAGAFALKSKIK